MIFPRANVNKPHGPTHAMAGRKNPSVVYTAEVLADSPSLFWRLNESSGTTAADSSTGGHDGTYTGTYTLAQSATDSLGYSVDLNGTTGRIVSTYNPFTNATTRTYEGWAYRDTDAGFDTVFQGSAANGPVLYLSPTTKNATWRPDAASATGQKVWSAAWPENATWVHWVLIFDEASDTVELFVNGATVGGAVASTGPYHGTPGDLIFGGPTDPFDGRMSCVAVYEDALSATRIAAHYAAGR